jgi:hypothetical protein
LAFALGQEITAALGRFRCFDVIRKRYMEGLRLAGVRAR